MSPNKYLLYCKSVFANFSDACNESSKNKEHIMY